MIELIRNQNEIEGRNLEGLYIVGGLSITLRDQFWLPAVPLFVERSKPGGQISRKIRISRSEDGEAFDLRLVPAAYEDSVVRVKNENVRFICETQAEVLRLSNAQHLINRTLNRRGFVEDEILSAELTELMDDLTKEGGEIPAL
mgnify:CR=1 FL=1|jgi:hypothetical protein